MIECNTFHPTNANQFCEEIILLKCGLHKTGFLTRSGKLYLAGNNQNGQLGLQNVTIVPSFTHIDYITDSVKDFGFGHSHTVILTRKNTIYSCGGLFQFLVMTLNIRLIRKYIWTTWIS